MKKRRRRRKKRRGREETKGRREEEKKRRDEGREDERSVNFFLKVYSHLDTVSDIFWWLYLVEPHCSCNKSERCSNAIHVLDARDRFLHVDVPMNTVYVNWFLWFLFFATFEISELVFCCLWMWLWKLYRKQVSQKIFLALETREGLTFLDSYVLLCRAKNMNNRTNIVCWWLNLCVFSIVLGFSALRLNCWLFNLNGICTQ